MRKMNLTGSQKTDRFISVSSVILILSWGTSLHDTANVYDKYTVFVSIIDDKRLQVDLSKLGNDNNKIHNDGDTLEDFYKLAHLDETRRKFLEGLKEGRENSADEENSAVMKNEINWEVNWLKNLKW